MPFPQVRINVDTRLANLGDELGSQIRAISNDWALDLAQELQEKSPRGATLDLASGWDVIPAARRRNTLDVRISIVNSEETAVFRVAGRGPGRPPPIEPIRQWAAIKGLNPFAVARKIANEGTERFKTGENFMGLNQDGTLQIDSFIFDRVFELERRTNLINI